MTPRSAFHALLVLVLLHAPSFAWACSVCMAGRDEENRLAYGLMTAFMTGLPLIVFGGFILWLRRRFRQLSDQESAESKSPGESRPAPALR